MTDAMEDDIITLLSKDDGLPWQFDLESATDQYDRCRSSLFRHPLTTSLAGLVNRPSDLNIFAAPNIACRHEMAKYPSPMVFPIDLGVSGIDQICHGV